MKTEALWLYAPQYYCQYSKKKLVDSLVRKSCSEIFKKTAPKYCVYNRIARHVTSSFFLSFVQEILR